jgi:tRNA threonylcarbamoyladenosine biosynthesis protein TsaB
MILAIDTSTDTTSVALYRPGDTVLAEQSWLGGREQTTQLLPNIQRLMSLVGANTSQIKGVAVATGPGSFSGVRIGLSTAKGMAYAMQIPIWGVPSLDVLAYQHAAVTAAQVCAVLRMGRGRVAWALYRTRAARWERLTGYENSTAQEMAESIQDRESNMATLFCGEISPDVAEAINEKMANAASIAPPAASLRRASYLAEIALQRSIRGETDDPATLHAIYLQPA